MATKKITELVELTALDDDVDVLAVSDISATETKKATIATARAAMMTAAAPAAVTKAAAVVGTGLRAAREDHKHDVLTDSAAAIAGRAASAEGTSSALARADHLHQISLAVTVASATPHTLAAETCVLVVDTSVSIDVQLPAPSNVAALIPVLIIDRENNASLKPISLLRAAAEAIDGVAATKVLDVDGGRWWLWTDGTNWFTSACSVPPSAAVPLAAAGTGAIGTAAPYARADHVHPAVATIATESGTARNVAAADAGKVIRCTAATTVTITVPAALTPGVTVEYVQEGAGQVQVVGSGVTLRLGATFNPHTAEQWSSLVVTVLDTDEALVRGDLAAV